MRLIFLIALLFPSLIFASTSNCEKYETFGTGIKDGKMEMLVVPGSKIKNAPVWSPKRGDPPIPIESVYALVTQWATDNMPQHDLVDIRTILAMKYGCVMKGDDNEYWYYHVPYRLVIKGDRRRRELRLLAVLMSGEIISTVTRHSRTKQ